MDHRTLKERLAGAFVALITPFDAADQVDVAGLRSNAAWMLARGLGGILLLGSTGEQVHLSEFERALVLEVGRQQIPADRLLIAGAGLSGTRQTIEETRQAGRAGADVALVVTPSYYQKAMNAANLTNHYRAVADASPIPIMLYSVPPIVNVTLPAEAVAALAGHPNIIGMKNSGGDPQMAGLYREAAAGHDFIILGGSAHAAPGFLLTGLVDGVILAAANVLPEAAANLVRAARDGDIAATRRYGELLRRVSETVGRHGIAGWKAGLAARGQVGGLARLPLRNITDSERQQVIAWTNELAAAL
ncbi:MAG: dihydrodipicolinate synthase family protein [Anaerolineae bacterium]